MASLFSLLLSLGSSDAAQAEAELSQLRWKNRVLILLAPSPRHPLMERQQHAFQAAKVEAVERDLVLRVETNPQGPLHRAFQLRSGFLAILVGKDGEEKWRSAKAFEMREVFQRIDSMPMRQSEMER